MYGCMLRTIVCAGGFFEGGMFFFSGEGGRRGGGLKRGGRGEKGGRMEWGQCWDFGLKERMVDRTCDLRTESDADGVHLSVFSLQKTCSHEHLDGNVSKSTKNLRAIFPQGRFADRIRV